MRVAEKDTDRTAEFHLHKDGRMTPLEEFGEYIDSKDQAVCCYAPVTEDDKIKIRGTFSGTTLAIAFDGIIDGITRKSNVFTAQKVAEQKNRRLDTETFLFKSKTGTVETCALIKPLSKLTLVQGEAPETVGTIELRLYVTRQLGVNHYVEDNTKYSAPTGHIEDDAKQTAYYSLVKPTFKITFDHNCAPLEKGKSTREHNRMNASRPGRSPWAIFRFHYRSKDAILEHNLKCTFDGSKKGSYKTHILVLDKVPPLPLGAKAVKEDGDNSTRASSSHASDAPPKSASKALSAKTSKSSTVQHSTESTPSPASSSALSLGDVMAEVVSKPQPRPVSQDTIEVISKPALKNTALFGNHKSERRESADAQEPTKQGKKTDNKTKESNEKDRNDSLFVSESESPLLSKVISNRTSQASGLPSKKPIGKPALTITTTQPIEMESSALATPLSATKRAADSADDRLDPKRARLGTSLLTPSNPMPTPRLPTESPAPYPIPIERQVAEERKRLADLRQKRKKMAEKQSAIDKEIEPFKKRMEEELRRLKMELMEEEKTLEEEEQHLNASRYILRQYQNGNSNV